LRKSGRRIFSYQGGKFQNCWLAEWGW